MRDESRNGKALSESSTPDPSSVLIVSFSNTASDPRVRHQIAALEQEFAVSVAGFGNPRLERAHFFQLKQANPKRRKFIARILEILEVILCFFKLYRINYWLTKPPVRSLRALLKEKHFDVVLANGPETIPVTVANVSPDTVCVHDQGEYWPDLFISQIKRYTLSGYRMWLMTEYAIRLKHWSVVGKKVGEEYEANAGLTAPVVISNAPRFADLTPSPVANNRIDLIHHGLWDPGRGVEKIISALGRVDDLFHLNLMLINSPTKKLQRLARDEGVADRVHFHPPVAQDQVAKFINQFDVEVIFIQPVNKNFEYALPNKLFEAIQARLAIVSGPLPEVAAVIQTEKIGTMSTNFGVDSLAATLRSLRASDIRRMKANTMEASRRHCAEANAGQLIELIQRALEERNQPKEG